jgi:acyl-CoA synthetase (NDP forming)
MPAAVRPAGVDPAAATDLLHSALAAGAQWLDVETATALLGTYGITAAAGRVVAGPDEAAAAAERLGYPLVAKLAVPGLHKTEQHGVRLDLRDEAALRAAVGDLQADGPQPVLLQRQAEPGIELIVGALQHDQFGPVVMLGAGGVHSDVIADHCFRLAPLAAPTALEMIAQLRSARLLDGYRGGPVVGREAVAHLLVRIAALIDDHPEVAELDLNPVIAGTGRLDVVDVRVRVATAPQRAVPWLRQLSTP